MALYVQKFGGSSMGSVERIRSVAQIISNTLQAGHQVVAVVSAMQGETDRLIQLMQSMGNAIPEREFAAAVTTGEQVSAALLATALVHLNCPAKSYTAWQIPIHSTSHYQKARITDIHTHLLQTDLKEKITPVVTGYQGIEPQNNLTTLGRGGSDLTAVALAAALQADECQIFTDVEGVYTSDPRLVKNVQVIPTMTFPEMLALADLGAKVLHNRSVELAEKYDLPLRVLSTFHPNAGTLITGAAPNRPLPWVSGIAAAAKQIQVSLLGLDSTPALTALLQEMNQVNIETDMLTQHAEENSNQLNIHFTVSEEDRPPSYEIISHFHSKGILQAFHIKPQMAKVSVVGLGMSAHAAVANKILQTLNQAGIDIHLIRSNTVKISVLIQQDQLQAATQLLHNVFIPEAR